MLTREENEMLTRVGPGTPCGELMRRYWHPIAATVQLEGNPVRKVRIVGEDLVLFRDRSGALGLIGPRCPHRAMHMAFGIPEEVGLRCPYHGWLFDGTGRCLEQPLAPPDSTFKDRVRTTAYKVQEMGGLIWAYLGPQPAPLLPRLDLCEREHELRQVVGHMLPCNWLQVMENRGDQPHAIYLHGRLFQYALDTEVPIQDANGEYILDYVLGQDMVAWYEQGEITDRTQEHLYEGDKVVIAYRQMLKEQIEIVQRGGDPMNVIRHPAQHVPWGPILEGWTVFYASGGEAWHYD